MSQKDTKELCVLTLKNDVKFEKELTCALKNGMRNLVYFHVSSHKSENLHFDELVLSKAYKVSDEKIQKSYIS